jgi:bacteriorhodopsin
MSVLPRRNDAPGVNPPTGVDEALSAHGSDFLWAITAIYVVAFVGPLVFISVGRCLSAIINNCVY